MVFGDAGSATLLTKGNNEIGFIINNQGSGFTDLIVPAGGFRNPCTANTSLEQVDFDGNVRCANDLYMNGAGIFNFAINKVPPMIERLLEMSLWKKESIDYYLFHQANNFMVNYLRKKLKISPGQVPLGVENYGNTGHSLRNGITKNVEQHISVYNNLNNNSNNKKYLNNIYKHLLVDVNKSTTIKHMKDSLNILKDHSKYTTNDELQII
jgi:hypothetical protein